MNPAPSILVYGRDTRLLETRALVLKHVGYRVATLEHWQEARSHSSVNLLILCHTLTQQQRGEALDRAVTNWPGAEKLCLTPLSGHIAPEFPVFDSFEGPEKLIAMVGKLIGR